MRRRDQAGFTLLELLIVVAIIAIVAAIAMMSYFNSITRAKQKRTMTDIRTIAAAWEARAADTRTYTLAGYSFPGTSLPNDSFVDALTPTYIRSIPTSDGWGRPFEFGVAEGESPQYSIRSAGGDGVFDDSAAPGTTQDPDCDIVYSNGSFVCYPEVASRN